MRHVAPSVRIWGVRALGARRALRRIAAEEPVWLVVTLTLALWGATVITSRLAAQGRAGPAFAAGAGLAFLLEATRSDERLVAVLGVNRGIVRLVDAVLWLSPLLGILAIHAPQSAVAAAIGVATGALLPTPRPLTTRRSSRDHRPQTRLVRLGATEWVAGLRRAPWTLVGSTAIGVAGAHFPLVVVTALVVSTLSATGYHWPPSEGWLLIHVSRRRARSFVWRKVGVSCALLAAVLAPVVVAGVVRSPSLAPVFAAAFVICAHAHVCGILCKYATYTEGARLSASGTLTWLLISAMIVLPPASVLALYFLERRAVERLVPYCLPARPADRRGPGTS